nr:MAG TPA: hypothetical protein [Caudoviricetes sp.]
MNFYTKNKKTFQAFGKLGRKDMKRIILVF